ncbi:MAG: signal peptidase I [Candidatus Korobacteraceae bacterium]
MPERSSNPIKASCVQYDSMEPTLSAGSDVIGDHSYYAKNKPKRWEVVVFSLAREGKSGSEAGHYVKRIIGLPGETIHLTPEGLKINGATVQVPPILKDRFSSFRHHSEHKFGNEPYKVPADTVFVIGDNQKVYVADSREFGSVPIRNLEARVLASVHTNLIT